MLIVTPRYPYPVIGGDRLRIYFICKILSSHFKLTLLSLCDSEAEMTSQFPADGIFHRIERVFLSKFQSGLNVIRAIPGRVPLQVAYYKSADFQSRIEELAPQHDGILAHLIRSGDGVRNISLPKFLEMTDAISLNYTRVNKAGGSLFDIRKFIYRIEVQRLKVYERKIVEDFNKTFLVSAIDRDFLFNDSSEKLSRVSIISNGVDLSGLPYNFSSISGDLIFIGNLYSLQNFDAVLFMAKDILPLIRSKRPEIRLRVIGRIGVKERSKLQSIDGIIVTGQVENVAYAAMGGAIGVCPMRVGAGIQNKVLEYMSLGLPTVTTSIGLEGFEAKNSVHLSVKDNPTEFAAEVLRLLDDRVAARIMAENGRQYVEVNHSWNSILQPMVEIISCS